MSFPPDPGNLPPGPPEPDPVPGPVEAVTCYRHADRRAGVVCQRCDRPICPSCMTAASVGFHCPECVKRAAKSSPTITARSMGTSPPVITYALIGLNVLAFLAVLTHGGTLMDGGGSLTTSYGLVGGGATGPNTFVGVGFHEWYRLYTGAFLHAGLIHLGLNMFVLWIIGAQLERIIGPARYLALYVVALVAGSFAVMLVDPGALTVGASGAIFGIMGAAAAYQRSRGINLMQSGLGGLILLNLVFSFAIPGISVAGHIGGLIGGLLTGWLVLDLDRRTKSVWVAVGACAAITVALTIAGVWAANHYVATGQPFF